MGGTAARAAVAQLPHAPGVYRFRDASNRVLYVGRASDLRRRVDSYWTNLGDRQHLQRMVRQIARVEAVWCDSEHEAAWFERTLLEERLPRWNRTRGGQEVPVYVRLDPSPRAPGVSVVHDVLPAHDAPCFGPYLGGARVRLAVAALHRALPLAYTRECLPGAMREMARRLGVSPADRCVLVDRLTRVLRREAEAVASVRERLVAAREAAAERLAFEVAARIHAELEALDWIVAPQNVCLLEPRTWDAYGWCDGILVHFGMRAGRLCTWREQRADETQARRRVVLTPPEWEAFANRNAQLAARLQLDGRRIDDHGGSLAACVSRERGWQLRTRLTRTSLQPTSSVSDTLELR